MPLQAGLHNLADTAISGSPIASQPAAQPDATSQENTLAPAAKRKTLPPASLPRQALPEPLPGQTQPQAPPQEAPPAHQALLQLSPDATPQQVSLPGSALPPACKRQRTEGTPASSMCSTAEKRGMLELPRAQHMQARCVLKTLRNCNRTDVYAGRRPRGDKVLPTRSIAFSGPTYQVTFS